MRRPTSKPGQSSPRHGRGRPIERRSLQPAARTSSRAGIRPGARTTAPMTPSRFPHSAQPAPAASSSSGFPTRAATAQVATVTPPPASKNLQRSCRSTSGTERLLVPAGYGLPNIDRGTRPNLLLGSSIAGITRRTNDGLCEMVLGPRSSRGSVTEWQAASTPQTSGSPSVPSLSPSSQAAVGRFTSKARSRSTRTAGSSARATWRPKSRRSCRTCPTSSRRWVGG